MGAILYTEGGELQYLDGRDYIGEYHIMPDGTPMGGAVHTGNEDILRYNPNRANISPINPSTFFNDGFELADQTIIPSFNVDSFFNPEVNRIEYFVYDFSRNLIFSNPNFKNYTIENNISPDNEEIEEIILFPQDDINNAGFDQGTLFGFYNFITTEIPDIFISEISSDRTEIRLQSNILSSEDIREEVTDLKNKIDSVGFFDEFYLNLGDNNYYIAVNILLDSSTTPTSFLVKLYEPLPTSITTKTQLEIVSKISETQGYEITFPPIEIPSNNLINLRGPNVNLKIKDKINNSTEFKNLSILESSSFTASFNQSQYLLNQKGIPLNPSYSISGFGEFVHFSSAKKRLENFYYKVGQIESHQNSINSLLTITSATANTTEVSGSIESFKTKINEIVTNFDGYEYFLYFTSGSDSYPKLNSNAPYNLQSTGSTEVLTWLGSDVVGSTYYGGALFSASRFDDDNPSNLFYTIPEYIRDNNQNNNYIEFSNLVGQHFDDIWLYIKSITDKLISNNNLDTGAPLDLIEEILQSFGYDVYGNNFDSSNIFTGLLGINESGSYFPSTGNELIQTAISASNEPIPIERVSKEIYKRLYHNLVYLAKRKGSVSGLRSLINIFGLPDTILRSYEFGGKDKKVLNDWDLYRRIFNKELTSFELSADLGKRYLGGVETPWKLNTLWSSSANIANVTGSIPATVEFRFKSDIDPCTTPSQSIPLQPLWGLKDNSGDTKVLVYLEYKGSGSFSGSFSGSTVDPNCQYADLTLAVSGSPPTSASFSLPFYNQDWWNVRVQMQELGLPGTNQARYQIASANKIYNGKDGTQIGFTGSTTHNEISGSWVNSTTSSFALTRSFNGKQYTNFSGSLQEIRYWTLCFNNQSQISESVWDNHVMDPLSIETGYLTGSFSPVDHLAFRSREGEDIGLISGSRGNRVNFESIHPRISGSYALFGVTSSFAFDDGSGLDSLYHLITGSISNNVEIQFLNNPNLGIKNRISDKTQIYNNVAYSDTLSAFRSIQQNYESSQSFTEDTNLLQVAFSPQDEVNDDIIHELGFNLDLTEQLADPRYLSSSFDHYKGLREIAASYFKKYFNGNTNDYYRLIKFVDNSLFKTIKNYVPARTSVSTGIVVKQHLLERNRVKPPAADINTIVAKTPETASLVTPIYDTDGPLGTGLNSPLILQNIALDGVVKSQPRGYITGSSIQVFSGGTGGSFELFNGVDFHPYGPSGSGPFNRLGITQSFSESIMSISGSVTRIINNQDEFYNGEFSGSQLVVSTQSLNPHCDKFKNVSIRAGILDHEFDRFVYLPDSCSVADFTNPDTAPRSGEILFLKNVNSDTITNIKISNTTKTSTDLSNILPSVNNITFDFAGSNQNVNVSFAGGGSNYTAFDVISPTFTYNSLIFTSNFLNYSASAVRSSSLDNVRISDIQGSSPLFFKYEVPITDFETETDPSGLFNTSSGIYTSPLTNNRILSITGSISGSYTFQNLTTATASYSIETQVVNSTRGDIYATTGNIRVVSPGVTDVFRFDHSITNLITPSFNSAFINGDEIILRSLIDFSGNIFDINGTGSLNISSSTFAVNQFPAPDEDVTSTITAVEPGYLSDNTDFIHSFDCQPLFNNVMEIRPGTLYYVVDYTQGNLIPVNIIPIQSQSAEPARIPDSNYTQFSHISPRYLGTKLTSLVYNFYSPPDTSYQDRLLTRIWEGDKSYGKTPVIDKIKPNFGYFQLLVPTSPELEDATQVKLKYLIDKEGNPFKPLLNSPSFFNVEGTFETNDRIDIALEDTLQTDDPSLTNAAVGVNLDNFNISAPVIRGARRVDPILTTQVVSVFDTASAPNTQNSAFSTSSINFPSPYGEVNNYYFATYHSSSGVAFNFPDDTLPLNQNGLTIAAEGLDVNVDFTSEVDDFSNGFSVVNDEYTFPSTPIPGNTIRFRFRGFIRLTTTATIPDTQDIARVSIVKRSGGVDTRLNTFRLDYTTAEQAVFVDIDTQPRSYESGDKVFVEFLYTDPFAGSFQLNGGKAEFSFLQFQGIPSLLPSVEQAPPFFLTGSANDNYITASTSMSQYFNTVQQEPYENSTFKPINEKFTVKVGDEFRFQGNEQLTHLVTEVIAFSDTGATSGSLVIKVQPPVPGGIEIDEFLLRRYNPDGTSVLIDLKPPSSSFATTKGVIKNITIDEKLEENIGNILSRLSEEGTI